MNINRKSISCSYKFEKILTFWFMLFYFEDDRYRKNMPYPGKPRRMYPSAKPWRWNHCLTIYIHIYIQHPCHAFGKNQGNIQRRAPPTPHPPSLLNILMYLQNFTNSENPAACSTEDCMTSAFQTVDRLQYRRINEKLVFRPLPDIPQALSSKLEVK